MDEGPDRNSYDAGILVRLSYRKHSINSVPGDWVTMLAREFCILCSFLTWVSGTTKSNELATDMAVSRSRCL